MKVYRDPQGDPFSLIIVNKTGKAHKLYTPFKVVCIYPSPGIGVNTQVYVDAVIGAEHGGIFYLIFEVPRPHTCFLILTRL